MARTVLYGWGGCAHHNCSMKWWQLSMRPLVRVSFIRTSTNQGFSIPSQYLSPEVSGENETKEVLQGKLCKLAEWELGCFDSKHSKVIFKCIFIVGKPSCKTSSNLLSHLTVSTHISHKPEASPLSYSFL